MMLPRRILHLSPYSILNNLGFQIKLVMHIFLSSLTFKIRRYRFSQQRWRCPAIVLQRLTLLPPPLPVTWVYPLSPLEESSSLYSLLPSCAPKCIPPLFKTLQQDLCHAGAKPGLIFPLGSYFPASVFNLALPTPTLPLYILWLKLSTPHNLQAVLPLGHLHLLVLLARALFAPISTPCCHQVLEWMLSSLQSKWYLPWTYTFSRYLAAL